MSRMTSWIGLAYLLLSAAPLMSQETLRWETDLASAQRLAAQTNRLVLVHFWGTWCGPCMQMERDVFSKPGLGTAISPYYVPVKVQCEDGFDNPLVKQFGVEAFPCDVVMTAQGQIVHRSKGAQPAEQYVSMLQKAAQTALTQARTVASTPPAVMPSTAPAATAIPTPPTAPVAPPASAVQLTSGDDRYAHYRDRLPATPGAPPTVAPVAPPLPTPPVAPPISTPISAPPVAATPAPAAPIPAAPPAVAAVPPAIAPPAAPLPSAPIAPPIVAAPVAPQLTPPAAAPPVVAKPAAPAPVVAAPIATPPAVTKPVAPAPIVATSPAPVAPAIAAQPAAPTVAAKPALPPPPVPAAPPVVAQAGPQLPPGCPPLALDGFCPVCVTEKMSWKKGDVKFGAIHRGRTYLFTSADDQKKFLADPDRFSPVMSGNDPVVALEKGEMISGNRKYGLMCQERMFLFSSKESYDKFCTDSKRYAGQTFQAMQLSGDAVKRR